jgi:hypothetical protein
VAPNLPTTETNGGDLPVWSRSPLPRAARNRPQRRVFRSSPDQLQTERDSLADDAVLCERFSESNWMLSGSTRARIAEIPCIFPDDQRKCLIFSRVFVEIPYTTEQGILKREQGTIAPEQGIFLEQQGNRYQTPRDPVVVAVISKLLSVSWRPTDGKDRVAVDPSYRAFHLSKSYGNVVRRQF